MSSASNIPAMNDITWIVFPSLQIKMNTNIYHLLLTMLNPLTPKSDKHLISPYNITLNHT